LELPTDSDFAVALKNQKQADREEQQRIKNLVLNLDLGESEDQDGDFAPTPLIPNPNIYMAYTGRDKPSSFHHNRPNQPGKDRAPRARKLQLSDVDWYGRTRCDDDKMSPDAAMNREVAQSEAQPRDYAGPGRNSKATYPRLEWSGRRGGCSSRGRFRAGHSRSSPA